MDVFGGDAIGEGRIGGRDGFFFGSGGDSERVGGVEVGLDSGLEPMLEEEFEENAVKLYSYARHCLFFFFYPLYLYLFLLSFSSSVGVKSESDGFLGLVCFMGVFGREEEEIIFLDFLFPIFILIDQCMMALIRGRGDGGRGEGWADSISMFHGV